MNVYDKRSNKRLGKERPESIINFHSYNQMTLFQRYKSTIKVKP